MSRSKSACVVSSLVVLIAGITCAESPTDSAVTKSPPLAAYRWGAANKNGGAAANEAYAKWMNLPVVWAEDFEPSERWDSIEGGSWANGRNGRRKSRVES